VIRETTSRGLCGLVCPSHTSQHGDLFVCLLLQYLSQSCSRGVCVFVTAVPSTKLFAWGGGGNNGGHVLPETTSRGLCGLGCPSRTSERGGEGDCVKEGVFGGEEEGGGVRSGPRAAGTILLFHIISARPPKQPRMVRTFPQVHTRPRLAYALWCRGY
jgi:hypothetical protein